MMIMWHMDQQPQPGPETAAPETVGESESDCPILNRAKEFSCMCSTAECLMNQDHEDDGRKGCVTQFTPEEIVAFQLSLREMDGE